MKENKLYVEKLKKLIEQEYIYIYTHDVTFVDLCHEGHIVKNDVAGTIITTIDKSYNTFIIEVVKNEK